MHTEGIFIAKVGVTHSSASGENPEYVRATKLGIRTLSYPQALAEISNPKLQIAVAGSHGKSSTTSLIGVMLQASEVGGSTIVGTKLPQFGGKNIRIDNRSDWFAIEACEYKRHFLEYTPYIAVITNIDIDHLDYYRDEADYLSAFVSFVERTRHSVVLSALDPGCRKLYEVVPEEVRNRLAWHWVDLDGSEDSGTHQSLPHLTLKVPGEHLRLDANLAYIVGEIAGIPETDRILGLEGYSGSWRRSEVVGTTPNRNLVMSDYGHHPSELKPTFRAIRERYPNRKLVVVFQPHQAARTRALLDEFSESFGDADEVIIPNIYLSRDTPEDIEYMTTDRLVAAIAVHDIIVRN